MPPVSMSSDTGRFTWLLGGYYQNDKYDFPIGNGNVSIAATGMLRSLRIEGTNPHTALAGFGQAGYKLTNALRRAGRGTQSCGMIITKRAMDTY